MDDAKDKMGFGFFKDSEPDLTHGASVEVR